MKNMKLNGNHISKKKNKKKHKNIKKDQRPKPKTKFEENVDKQLSHETPKKN